MSKFLKTNLPRKRCVEGSVHILRSVSIQSVSGTVRRHVLDALYIVYFMIYTFSYSAAVTFDVILKFPKLISGSLYNNYRNMKYDFLYDQLYTNRQLVSLNSKLCYMKVYLQALYYLIKLQFSFFYVEA